MSFEPSSTTKISISFNVWLITLSMHSEMNSSPLYTGIITETLGCVPVVIISYLLSSFIYTQTAARCREPSGAIHSLLSRARWGRFRNKLHLWVEKQACPHSPQEHPQPWAGRPPILDDAQEIPPPLREAEEPPFGPLLPV